MAERDIRKELFEAQQQTITSFVESVERDISANSELAQSLLKQTSGVASRSLQEQLEGLIAKEEQNASKLRALEEIQNETMAIAEEQQRLIEEAQLRLPTPQTSAVESASEAEIHSGARPKRTPRVTIRSPQVETVPVSKISKDQEMEARATLLRDKVFNIVPGTVNVNRGGARARKVDMKVADEVYDSQRLPQVPDTPMVGGGMTFPEHVSSTPCVRLHPSTVDLSGVSSTETSDKETEDELIGNYHPRVKNFEGGARPKTVHPVVRTKQEKSKAAHSLQTVAEEFKKMREPKISKLKGGYSANAMLVFNSWLKDIKMCVQERKLSNLEAVQLIKDFTSDNARGAVEFYLDTNSTWNYKALIEHLRTSFETGESFSSLVGDFYSRSQRNKETEDQFADELQVLSRKVLSIRPEWRAEVNEALKTQFAFRLRDPYLAAMARNFLKTQGKDMSFTQFRAECVFMFGSRTKKVKVSTTTHAIENVTSAKPGEQRKSNSQLRAQKNKKKWQVQTELIDQQKREIEKLKAAQAPGIDTQQLVKAITQAMSCMYVGTKKVASDQETKGKPFLGTSRPSELSKGLDGSLDPNLSCRYCKDTGHEKENCGRLQKKLARDRLVAQEQRTLGNDNHH